MAIGHWFKNFTKWYFNPKNEGGGDSWTVLTEETVTTQLISDDLVWAELSYSEPIEAETIKVTFNGTEYECSRIVMESKCAYGGVSETGPDFSEYPFALLSEDGISQLFTETAGTYTIKIEAPQSGGSSDFSTAQVTVTSNSIDGDGTEFPFAYVDRESSSIQYGAVTEYNNPLTYEAILFNGAVGVTSPTSNVSTSGSATVNPGPGGRTLILVTGDCTITIS